MLRESGKTILPAGDSPSPSPPMLVSRNFLTATNNNNNNNNGQYVKNAFHIKRDHDEAFGPSSTTPTQTPITTINLLSSSATSLPTSSTTTPSPPPPLMLNGHSQQSGIINFNIGSPSSSSFGDFQCKFRLFFFLESIPFKSRRLRVKRLSLVGPLSLFNEL